MSTKWKYASLPASERLEMVRSGNNDVYENEIARSLDVISSRKALGLDISEQKDWIDSVGYNYHMYNADRMGVEPSRVSQTGYADKILGNVQDSPKNKIHSTVTKKSNKEYRAKGYLEEFYGKVAEAAKKMENVKEWLLNNGIDEKSDTGKRYLEEFDKELDELTEKYRKEFVSKVKALY